MRAGILHRTTHARVRVVSVHFISDSDPTLDHCTSVCLVNKSQFNFFKFAYCAFRKNLSRHVSRIAVFLLDCMDCHVGLICSRQFYAIYSHWHGFIHAKEIIFYFQRTHVETEKRTKHTCHVHTKQIMYIYTEF